MLGVIPPGRRGHPGVCLADDEKRHSMRFHWHPTLTAYAEVGGEAAEATAPRDAGWAELWSKDGESCLGRGHLILWADANHIGKVVDAPVDSDSVQPVGESVADLRAEMRSFTPEKEMPGAGESYLVIPEHDAQRYPVDVTEVSGEDGNGKAILALDWPDDQLPTVLSELGGH